MQAVDDKGRVAIPADLRIAAERNSEARQVFVGMSEIDPCLTAYDVAWSNHLHAQLKRIETLAIERGEKVDPRAQRRAFGGVDKAPFDGSGRFVLPTFYRGKAKIGKWAFFSGAGDTFDIWAPEVLMTAPDVDPFLREMCEFLCQQKGVAL